MVLVSDKPISDIGILQINWWNLSSHAKVRSTRILNAWMASLKKRLRPRLGVLQLRGFSLHSYWISGAYAPPWSEKRTSFLKVIEKERLQGEKGDNNGVGRHRHSHAPGMQQEPLGIAYSEFSDADREAIVAAYPRTEHFKEDIIQTFYDGIKHKPETTFGHVKADVLADKDPKFQRMNFCSVIRGSPWKG